MNRKNIIVIICAMALMVTMAITVFAAETFVPVDVSEPTTTISEDYIPSETSPEEITIPEEEIILEVVEVKRVEPTTLDEVNIILENVISRKDTYVTIYEKLLALGYTEKHPVIIMIKIGIENAESDYIFYKEYQANLQEAHEWEMRASEYPVATQVWLYMKNEFGWSDIVCAGIMGNMMAECGGHWSCDLQWNISGSSGYGMIQWVGGRRKELLSIYGQNPTIEDQLNFMKDELYGTNGVTKQVTDSQLNRIMNAKTPEDCAYAFACYYERCHEDYRIPRRNLAKIAYNYFVS